jgi:hypothetical protein
MRPTVWHLTSSASAAQVLKKLANPSSPDAAKHMRQVALYLSKEGDTSKWLDSTLVPKLLGTLQSLPANHPPQEAVQVCAAAVAALNNLFTRLSRPDDRARFRAMLAANEPALHALVHWGICCPEAAQQLPQALDPHMGCQGQALALGPDGDRIVQQRSPFSTPLTYSMALLVPLVLLVTTEPAGLEQLQAALKEAVTATAIERLLLSAVATPSGTRWSSRGNWSSLVGGLPMIWRLVTPQCCLPHLFSLYPTHCCAKEFEANVHEYLQKWGSQILGP